MKLNQEYKSRIKAWLDYPDNEKGGYCPFIFVDRTGSAYTDCEICKLIFPEIELIWHACLRKYIALDCPCHIFETQIVIRKAKEWIR